MTIEAPSVQHRLQWSGLCAGLAALALLTFGVAALAETAPPQTATSPEGSVEPDGTIDVPAFRLPPSIYLSDEAKAALPRKPFDQEDSLYLILKAGKAPALRERMGELMASTVKHHADLYPVTMQSGQIADVPAVFVTPVKPMPAANRAKILLDLPGGGMVLGAAPGSGMVESIPLAALAQVQIVSITYRQAPEYKFPAASEDVGDRTYCLPDTHIWIARP